MFQVLNNEDVVNLDRVNKLLDQASNKRLGPVFDKFAVTSVERCSQVWNNEINLCDIWTNETNSCDIWINETNSVIFGPMRSTLVAIG